MALDLTELAEGLATLAAQNPEALAPIIAASLGMSPDQLNAVVGAGAQRVRSDELRALRDTLRARSAALLGADRDAIEAARRQSLAPPSEAD